MIDTLKEMQNYMSIAELRLALQKDAEKALDEEKAEIERTVAKLQELEELKIELERRMAVLKELIDKV